MLRWSEDILPKRTCKSCRFLKIRFLREFMEPLERHKLCLLYTRTCILIPSGLKYEIKHYKKFYTKLLTTPNEEIFYVNDYNPCSLVDHELCTISTQLFVWMIPYSKFYLCILCILCCFPSVLWLDCFKTSFGFPFLS